MNRTALTTRLGAGLAALAFALLATLGVAGGTNSGAGTNSVAASHSRPHPCPPHSTLHCGGGAFAWD